MQQDGVVDAFSQRNPSEMVLQIQHLDEPGPMWVDAQKQLFVVQKDGWIAGYRRGQTNFLVRYVDPESGGDNPAGLCGDRMGHLYFTTNELGGFISYVYQYDVGNPYYVADYSWGSDQGASVGGRTVDAAGDLIVSVRQGMPQTQLVEFPYPVFSSSPLTLQPALGTKRYPVGYLFEYNSTAGLQNCVADSTGDVFVSYQTAAGTGIDEFPSGSTTPVTLQTFPVYHPVFLALDAQRNLLVLFGNYYAGQAMQVFAPPYTGSAVRSFGTSYGSMAFDGTGKHLWTVGFQDAAEFDYKNGREMWYTAETGNDAGTSLAVSPQLTP
jgi:hypothetical protein